MKITRRQLRRIIRESISLQKDYHRLWDGKWMNSPDWQALEDGLIAMGREDLANMLISIYELGGSRYTFPKIQAAVDSEDHETLDKIADSHLYASRKQSTPKYGRY